MGSLVIVVTGLVLATLPYHEVVAVAGKKHRLFITIDDHPHKSTTGFLKVLKKCKLKATWFVWGAPEWYYRKVPKYSGNIKQHKRLIAIHRAGHILGNHSVTHRNLCKLSLSGVRWELRFTQKLVRKATGVRMKYWRAPFLSRCKNTRYVARKLKLRHVGVDIQDIKRSAKWMWNKVTVRARRGKKQTILLFHKDLSKFRSFLRLSTLCRSP